MTRAVRRRCRLIVLMELIVLMAAAGAAVAQAAPQARASAEENSLDSVSEIAVSTVSSSSLSSSSSSSHASSVSQLPPAARETFSALPLAAREASAPSLVSDSTRVSASKSISPSLAASRSTLLPPGQSLYGSGEAIDAASGDAVAVVAIEDGEFRGVGDLVLVPMLEPKSDMGRRRRTSTSSSSSSSNKVVAEEAAGKRAPAVPALKPVEVTAGVVGIGHNGAIEKYRQMASIAYDGRLLVGGPGFVAPYNASFLYAWDGYSWEVVGPAEAPVVAMTVWPGTEEAGDGHDRVVVITRAPKSIAVAAYETFSPAADGFGASVSSVSVWDGAAMTTLVEVDAAYAAVWRNTLILVGPFTTVEGAPCKHMCQWVGVNGTGVWLPLDGDGGPQSGPSAPPTHVVALASSVAVIGPFRGVGTVTSNNVAFWDGANWFGVELKAVSGDINAAAGYGDAVYVGGAFYERLLECWIGTCNELGAHLISSVTAIHIASLTEIYVASNGPMLEFTDESTVAIYNGQTWAVLPEVRGMVFALAPYCSTNYAGVGCVNCQQGYFGGSCDACAVCEAHGVCTEGRQGNCTCVQDGWTGPLCSDCAPGFYGADCTPCAACVPHGQCVEGRGGTCVCDSGWAGPQCNDCQPDYFFAEGACLACEICDAHGECFAGVDGNCTCTDPGWVGDTCSTCVPSYNDDGPFAAAAAPPQTPCPCTNQSDCSDHGMCVGNLCSCLYGYRGDYCELAYGCRTDEGACSEHGQCVEWNSTATACVCAEGYAGPICADRVLPPLNIVVAVAGPCAALLLAVLLAVAAGWHARTWRHYYRPDTTLVYLSVFTLYDFAASLTFTLMAWLTPALQIPEAVAVIATSLLALTVCANAVTATLFILGRLSSIAARDVEPLFSRRSAPVIAVIWMISFTNVELLALSYSNLFDLSWFRFPFEDSQAKEMTSDLNRMGWATVVLQNVPMLALQSYVVLSIGAPSTISVVCITSTTLVLLVNFAVHARRRWARPTSNLLIGAARTDLEGLLTASNAGGAGGVAARAAASARAGNGTLARNDPENDGDDGIGVGDDDDAGNTGDDARDRAPGLTEDPGSRHVDRGHAPPPAALRAVVLPPPLPDWSLPVVVRHSGPAQGFLTGGDLVR